MYDNKLYRHKIIQIRQYYNRVCIQDEECQQLKRYFMQAFYQVGVGNHQQQQQATNQLQRYCVDNPLSLGHDGLANNQNQNNGIYQQQQQSPTKPLVSFERFHQIYTLVYAICRRLHTNAIHSIWIICCETVLDDWSTHLERYINVDQLNYILQCWNRYQNANNLINTLTLYAQNKLFQTHRPGRIKSQINDICCHIFVEHFFVGQHQKPQNTVTSILKSPPMLKSSECNEEDGTLFCSIIEVINRCSMPINDSETMAVAPIDQQFRIRCMETVKDILALLAYVDSRSIVYYRMFAFPYLKSIQRQYQQRSLNQIQLYDGHVVDYLRYVELVMDQEISLANRYSFTVPFVRMIAKILYHELITRHQIKLCAYNSFLQLINGECWEHLTYHFNMVMYNSDAVKLLATNMENYLKSRLATIQLINWKVDRYTQRGAATFVHNCNFLMEHWNSVVMNTYNSDPTIGQSVTSSISHYLNSNPVFIPIIALYVHVVSMTNCPMSLMVAGNDPTVDDKQKNSSNPQDNLSIRRQAAISCAFKLLSFIDDKSAVIQFSHHFLCNRILYNLSYSVDSDIINISAKLDSLNIDIPFSVKLLLKDYNSSIVQSLNKSIDFNVENFEVKLLNSSLWNLDKSSTNFRLSKSFLESFNLFRRKYRIKNPKKSIKLNQNYGSVTILANFVENQQGPFHFEMSLRQTMILLMFDRLEQATFKQLGTLATIDTDSLTQCIKTFYQHGLIKLVENAEVDRGNNVDWQNSTYQINDNFQHNGGNFSTETSPINWIRLQYESADYNLEHLMHQCLDVGSGGLGGTGGGSGAGGSGSGSGPGSHAAPCTTTVEANQSGKNVRLEAAIIRTMKREKVVLDLNLLQQLVMETIGNRQIDSPSPPAVRDSSESSTNTATNKPKPSVLTINELRQIVVSLEKRGYLRMLDNETILYEP